MEIGKVEGGKFKLGSLAVEVDLKDIPKSLAAVNKLSAAEAKAFAEAYGLPVEPFDKQLLRGPLMGFLQIAIYAARDGKAPDAVVKAQEGRVASYKSLLEAQKNAPEDDFVAKASKKTKSAGAAPRDSFKYRLVEKTKSVKGAEEDEGWGNLYGQKFSVVQTMLSLGAAPADGKPGKGVTIAEISAAIKVFPGVKTPGPTNVTFHVNAFAKPEVGFVERVNADGSVNESAPKPKAPPAEKKAPAAPAAKAPAKKK